MFSLMRSYASKLISWNSCNEITYRYYLRDAYKLHWYFFKWLIANSCHAGSGKRKKFGCWSWQNFRSWWFLYTSFIYRTNSAGKADFRPSGKTVDNMFLIFKNIIQIEIWSTVFSLQGPSEDLKTKLSLHEDVLSPRPPTTPLSKSLTINKKGVCQTVYSKRYLDSVSLTAHACGSIEGRTPKYPELVG